MCHPCSHLSTPGCLACALLVGLFLPSCSWDCLLFVNALRGPCFACMFTVLAPLPLVKSHASFCRESVSGPCWRHCAHPSPWFTSLSGRTRSKSLWLGYVGDELGDGHRPRPPLRACKYVLARSLPAVFTLPSPPSLAQRGACCWVNSWFSLSSPVAWRLRQPPIVWQRRPQQLGGPTASRGPARPHPAFAWWNCIECSTAARMPTG